MDDVRALDRRYETVTWSALFIWLGAVTLIPGVPAGTGTVGVGIILLGLNLKRYLSRIPIKEFSTALGATAFILGIGKLLHSLLGLHAELQFFPVLLVVAGAITIIRAARPVTGTSRI